MKNSPDMKRSTQTDDYFNQIQESEPRRYGLLDYLIIIATGLAVVALYAFVIKSGGSFGIKRYLVDGFFVMGIVYITIGVFSFVNHEGLFDGAAYGIKKIRDLRRSFFKFSMEREPESKKENYIDFVKKRKNKRKGVRHPFLSIGFAFFLISMAISYLS